MQRHAYLSHFFPVEQWLLTPGVPTHSTCKMSEQESPYLLCEGGTGGLGGQELEVNEPTARLFVEGTQQNSPCLGTTKYAIK